jgi:aspartate-semialdehyde dehydrogenase
MLSGYKVAVIGATSIIGTELTKILEERCFPVKELVALGAKEEQGDSIEFNGDTVSVQAIQKESFKGIDFSFFAGDESLSKDFVPFASRHGVAIDTSPAFRMKKDVPLIVPEVNSEKIRTHKGIIASPHSSAVFMALTLSPIHKKAGIEKVVVSAYQSVSAMGKRAVDELAEQIKSLFNFREPDVKTYPHQIAFNVLPHAGKFLLNAYTEEEISIAEDTKKILNDDSMRICATVAYVPVLYGHALAINIVTKKPLDPDAVKTILNNAPGITVEDDPRHSKYPLPVYAAGTDECFVGRIREDISTENGIAMWIASDNIRKGAALNAVQIAEHLIQT